MRQYRQRMDQRGAASMMSVAIFAIIVTIVVTAYLRSAISQQSQSITYDLSTRAYYAAESGIQDAIRALNANPALSAQDSCDRFVPASANGGVLSTNLSLKYTCQLINTTPDNIQFSVREDQNATVRLLPADAAFGSGEYQLVIRWSKANNSGLVARDQENSFFPAQGAWVNEENQQIHPILRTSLITYAKDGVPNINQRVLFMNPLGTGIADGQGAVTMNATDAPQPVQEKLVRNARCYNADEGNDYDGYLCEQVITMRGYSLSSNSLFARIRSLYGATDVQLSIRREGQPSVPLSGSVVEIDVTGNAGSTFRRVRQTYNLQDGVMFDNLPEAAVIGGDGICKYYSITDEAAGFDNAGQCFVP